MSVTFLTNEDRTELENQIGELSAEIYNSGDTILPSYYDDYLPGKIEQVKSLMDEAGSDGTAFIMFSDSHMELYVDGQNGGNSGKLAYHVADQCKLPLVMYLGDATSNSPQETEALCLESMEAFNSMVKPLDGKLIQVLGNHDGAWGAAVDGVTYPYNMTRNKVYNRLLQRNHLGMTKVFSPDGRYFYADDCGSKTRMIMLNTSDKPYETNDNGTMTDGGNVMKGFVIRQAQVDWLVDSLNTVPDGWHVCTFAHPPLHNDFLGSAPNIRSLLQAYKNKTAYSGAYDGEYSGGSGGYTNLFDASGDGYSLSGTTMLTNYIDAPLGSTVHIKSSNNCRPYKIHGYDSTKTKLNTVYIDGSSNLTAADYDSTVYTVTSGCKNAAGELFDYPTWTYVVFEFREVVPTDLIITVNENIEGDPGGSGGGNWDALSIDADFASANGEFIAHFCGHTHNDYHYPAADFGIDMISVACDGRVVDVNGYMTDETYLCRALGTIYEQILDVVVVNKADRTIKTVRLGAGADREISY